MICMIESVAKNDVENMGNKNDKVCILLKLLWSTDGRFWKEIRNYSWFIFCKVSYICDAYQFVCDTAHICDMFTFFCLKYLGEGHHGVESCLNSGFEKLAGIVVQEKSPRNHRGKYNDGPEMKKIKPEDTSVDVAISASLIPTKTLLFYHQS